MMATALDSRKLFDQNWKRILFWGSICSLSQVFICLVGLPSELNRRILIESTLSLGYLFILWIPLAFGYIVSKIVELEGIEKPKSGAADLLSGALTGLLGSLGLILLMLGIENIDMRDPLINWNPKLFRLLTFENSIAFGTLIWIAVGVGLGTIGASLHQISDQIRKMLAYATFGLFSFAILEDVIDDLSEGFRLEWLSDLIYAKKGGMTVTSTIVLALVLAALPLLVRGKVKTTVARYRSEATPEGQRRNSIILFSIIAVFVIVLPWFLGGIINELLANVGLFLLLALGLNIVVGLAGLLDLGYVAFFAVGGYTTAVFTSFTMVFPRNSFRYFTVGRCGNGHFGRSPDRCPSNTNEGRLSSYRYFRIRRNHKTSFLIRLVKALLRWITRHYQHPSNRPWSLGSQRS